MKHTCVAFLMLSCVSVLAEPNHNGAVAPAGAPQMGFALVGEFNIGGDALQNGVNACRFTSNEDLVVATPNTLLRYQGQKLRGGYPINHTLNTMAGLYVHPQSGEMGLFNHQGNPPQLNFIAQNGQISQRGFANVNIPSVPMAQSANGLRIATAHQNGIGVYDTRTGNLLNQLAFDPIQARKQNLAFNSDGTLLASAFNGGIQIWDLQTGKDTRVQVDLGIVQERVEGITFSPDGRYVVFGVGSRMIVYDTRFNKVIANRDLKESIRHIKFSPDGNHLAIATGLGVYVANWDMPRVKPGALALKKFRTVDNAMVSCLEFSPGGRLAVGTGSIVDIYSPNQLPAPARMANNGPALDAATWKGLMTVEGGLDAMSDIMNNGPQGLAFLRTHLPTLVPPPMTAAQMEAAFRALVPARLAQTIPADISTNTVPVLIRLLDSSTFQLRQAAQKVLGAEALAEAQFGRPQVIRQQLTAALVGATLEKARRIEAILNQDPNTPNGVRAQYVVQMLERYGALADLQALERTAPWLVRSSLRRMGVPPPPVPMSGLQWRHLQALQGNPDLGI